MPCGASVIDATLGVELLMRFRTNRETELSLGSPLCVCACKLIFASTVNQPALKYLQ